MKKPKLCILILLLFSIHLYAQSPLRDMNKEHKIEDQLKSIDSSLVGIFIQGTIEMDQNNLNVADSLYSIVYNKAKLFDPVIRRLGTIQLQNGNIQKAIEYCQLAIDINRSAYNLLSLSYCYLSSGKEEDVYKAESMLKEAQKLPDGDDPDIFYLLGHVALKENNIGEFRSITNELVTRYPDEMVTHYFSAILASNDKDWKRAEKEIMLSKSKGLPEKTVQEFLDSGVSSNLNKKHILNYILLVVGIWALGLFFLYIIGKLLSNITLRSIEKQALNPEQNENTKFLRPLYKLFINFGGIYYYVSLPVILILVVALVVVLFYFFLYVGRIPIQLMLVLILGSGFTIYGMIKSLLVKIDYSDPGRKLNKEEAPELFKLTDEVANAIGTRPIDEIRITPTTDLAVYERGSWTEKIQDRAKRILILGIGVLKDFNQSDFRAVLAHEYGHFSHRDTAGGDVALRVRNDINKYFYALYMAGQNVWWNVAFHFLRLYNFIFQRISHGSTRLQEVQADKVAAMTYGKLAFENGLTYVIKRSIEFNVHANQEIDEAKKTSRPFNNLYELTGNSKDIIDKEFKESLSRKTTEDDTHPSPVDRFRFISNIKCDNINYDNTLRVKDFFLNWDSITQEMTNLIQESVNKDN